MSSLDEARQRLGELFIIGFNGIELSDDTSAFLSQAKIGGVILFAPNYESPGQVAELINQVQECRGDLPLWVSVDQEGGRVRRFKKPFVSLPDAQTIGTLDSPKLLFEVTAMMCKELRSVGININYAPVADIMTNPKNPVIGNRAYGSNEEQVSKMVTAVVRGHLVSGVQACVKHFPGHGDTSVDSHFALPKVDTSPQILRDREFKPFIKAFKSRCSMVMTAHVLISQIDPELPATLSTKILQNILRQELRYSKIIISDDLEMKAITDHYGAAEAPVMAVKAGCDLLIYRTEAGARAAYEAMVKALEDGKLPPEAVLQAAERSRSLKKEFLMPYQPVVVGELGQKIGIPEHQELLEKLAGKPTAEA
ncbi:beta-N-acetylhexosaminidase [bacterium]|jgi:beta-N-acetylhexosaminidase|nr:beta-N-acetylhexosaminidase [bacterium]